MSLIIQENCLLEKKSMKEYQVHIEGTSREEENKTSFDFIQKIKIKGLEKINKLPKTEKFSTQIQLFELPNLQQKIIPILQLKFSKLEPLVEYNVKFLYKQSLLKVLTSQQRLWAVLKLLKLFTKLHCNVNIIVQMSTGLVKLLYKSPKFGKQYKDFSFLEKSINQDIKLILSSLSTNKSFLYKILIPDLIQSNLQNQKINKICQYIRVSHLDFSFSTKAQECSYNSLQEHKKKCSLFKNLHQRIDLSFQFKQNNLYVFSAEIKKLLPSQTEFQMMEQGQFAKYLHMPEPSNISKGQNKYICNFIKPIFIQDCTSFFKLKEGGFSKIKIFKMKFHYVYSCNQQNSKKQNLGKQQFQQNSQKDLIKYLALKTPKSSDSTRSNIQQTKSKHENKIVKLFRGGSSGYLLKYYIDHNNFQNVYMDYLPDKLNLAQFLQLNRKTLSIYSKIHLLSSISNSLRFLKKYQIVHMDLNPSNILVFFDYLIKLIDFGESFHQSICIKDSKVLFNVDKEQQSYNPGYTLPYSSPEVFTKYKFFTSAQDVFSFGVLAFEMITNQFLFHPSQQLLTTFKKRTYHQKIFFSPQKFCDSKRKEISLIIGLLFKSIHQNQELRPIPSWLTIILKQIYFI